MRPPPLYHVGTAAEYPPMHFVVSDQDMECRYGQTMLMLATLRHFGYDGERIGFAPAHGKHCEHNKRADENGHNLFGKMVLAFIQKYV